MDQERYDAAGVVLWLVGALNLIAGVPLIVAGMSNDEGFATTMGAILVVTALVLGGLGFPVRKRSRVALIAAVVLMGLVLALRAAPLLAGEFRLGTIISVAITTVLFVIVARPLAR